MKKSIFKASFEENLNLLDDVSLQFTKKDYYEHLGKGLNNGRPSIGFRIKSIIFTILFVFGGNFMLAVFAFSLNDADPKDLSIPIFKPQLLTPEFFLIASFIWLILVVIGKIFRKPFIRPYRYRFHIVTFLIWFCIEFNLLGITVALPTLKPLGIYFIYFAIYGTGLLGLAVIIKTVLSYSGMAISQNLTLLGLLLTWIVLNVGFLAMIAFMELPFFLEGYYKWKYPEEYREWEGKSLEDWYGKKYLNKHRELLKNE